MAQIQILPQQEIVKIAAGEVVRRPASVVKELIENSLDAGATSITIRVFDAGFSLIQITDDGVGMSQKDVKLSVVPHATSKITTLNDLSTLMTFGFRGEALASIAAVSDLEIITAQKNESNAQKLFFQLGSLITEELTSAPTGTTISVQNLFYNIPVRRKFLKSKETESNQIKQAFINLALAHQNITFKLFENDKLLFNAIATPILKERLAQLFDHNIAQNMLTFSWDCKDFQLTGLTSNLHITRYNKSSMLLFVNNRAFRDAKISNALCLGYAGALPANRFPVTVLNIMLDPAFVDVNIHPAKEEVAFLSYGKIINACKEAVHKALELEADFSQQTERINIYAVNTDIASTNTASRSAASRDVTNSDTTNADISSLDQASKDTTSVASLDLASKDTTNPESFNSKVPASETDTFKSRIEKTTSFFGLDEFEPLPNYILQKSYNYAAKPSIIPQDSRDSREHTQISGVLENQKNLENQNLENQKSGNQKPENQKIDEEEGLRFTILGQLFNTYIIYERNNRLGLIDQHAASERILYEEMKGNFTNLPTTKLLFPIICDIDQEALLKRILILQELLLKFGIECDQFGKTSITVTSLPPGFAASDLKGFFIGIAEALEFSEDHDVVRKHAFEQLHAQLACKRAIKAGEPLSPAIMEALVKRLQNTTNKYQCIHGRPTTYEFSKNEVAKWFRR